MAAALAFDIQSSSAQKVRKLSVFYSVQQWCALY